MKNKILDKIKEIQKDEITGWHIYNRLAKIEKEKSNSGILEKIAADELVHYNILKKYTGRDVKPLKLKILFFIFLARTAGLTFSLKLMEKTEKNADTEYRVIGGHVPELEKILRDEDEHEKTLINMISEEKLEYAGSIVLGLNDALVELTGALAGFTFAIQNSRTIALMGLITGIAATLSMAASEFLSQRQEDSSSKALKSSIYTGTAYLVTVTLLILPFFLFSNHFINLAVMMGTALLIILAFNYYISVAKDLPFGKRFAEMALISTTVALVSFGIGWAVRTFFGFDI